MGTKHRGSPREVRALDAFIKLTRAAGSVGGRLYGQLVREEGITESQLGVLEALHHLGSMSQGQLCGKLLKSGSNLTTVIDNLERDGLVRRERDADDRRVQIVHLTEEGQRVIRRVFPGHVQRMVDAMSALSADEQQELGRLCRKLGTAQEA
jgi:MarR family 2-MHQ and catechol resistance regulon transcriptional repressor